RGGIADVGRGRQRALGALRLAGGRREGSSRRRGNGLQRRRGGRLGRRRGLGCRGLRHRGGLGVGLLALGQALDFRADADELFLGGVFRSADEYGNRLDGVGTILEQGRGLACGGRQIGQDEAPGVGGCLGRLGRRAPRVCARR